MPELPEVETLRRSLLVLQGRRVSGVRAYDRLVFEKPLSPVRAVRILNGLVLETVKRRGKYLVFEFDRGSLIFSPRMTGRALLLTQPPRPAQTVKLELGFSGGSEKLYLTTVRRFSRIYWLERGVEFAPFVRLGPEPIGRKFTFSKLLEQVRGRKAPVKTLLLNQEVIAGLGNIYVCEVLARTGIHPERAADTITEEEWKRIHQELPKLLRQAIYAEGTTFANYTTSSGKPGRFQLEHLVYNRQGQPCLRCGAEVRRSVLAGRGTFFCPGCQK